MGQITAEWLLEQVSYALIEVIVNTSLSAPVTAGIRTVTPLNMQGIYQGVTLVIGQGAQIEDVAVTSVTASTFTATFLNTHAGFGPAVVGATFSGGQPNTPLWSQQEMLDYLTSTQNEFLCAVRPVYAVATQNLEVGIPSYPNPADAIRVERVAIAGTELWNVSQTDIDWQGGYSSRAGQQPQYWYQDKVGPFNFAVDPIPQVGAVAELFYSQLGSTSLGLLSTFTVPDLFWPALKWGTLAKALSKDGEQRDLSRSAYCQQKFTFWQILASKFMEGLESRFASAEETVEPVLAKMGKG